MTDHDANGRDSDATEPRRAHRPTDEQRERSAGDATSRRTFLRAVGTGALVGSVAAGDVLAAPGDAEFVGTDGTQFVLGDRPVYFNGTNNFWIADPYADRARVDDFVAICDELNFDLVRTWAFCSGDGGHCLQPEPGVYDEAGFQHLDYVIAKAREAGVRLVLPLVNNWDDYGGMAQYVEWSSTASSHDDFYVDDECQRLYRDFVEYVLTRENSITGVEYRNEPAIAVWELANEPRAKDASDGVSRITRWIEETSALIKDLDSNHLVSTGMEGFYDAGGDDWRHDGSHGTAFVDQHRIDTIDACSFHLYPDHWPGIDPTVPRDGVDWIVEHVRDAHETVGKPVYLGEFGINTNENSQSVRDDAFEAYYGALDEYDADGAMLWEVVRDSQDNHDGYAVYQTESSITYVDEFTAAQYEKSGGGGSSNGGPYADAVGPDSLRVGETGSFDASLSFDPEQAIGSYDWSFGDGATATGERAGHRYTETGSYTVDLTVTDDGGATGSDAETVSVESLPSDSFLVEGAGETVAGTTKEFHYAYVSVSGEFSLTARVTDLEPTAADAQAGILTLDALDSPGPLGAVTVTPGEGTELTRAYRDETWRERTSDGRSPPLWLRLERTARSNGDFDVTGSVSGDGSSWTEIQTGQVGMAADAYVGLYVSSNDAGKLCTAQFDEVTWLDGWASTDVGSVEVAGHATSGSGGGNGTPTDTETATDTDTETETDAPADDALVINDYDGSPAWSSGQNDLGQWCGAGSFANGSGEVRDGALVLEYDDGGWFQEQINRSVSDYSTLVFSISGANGGEESDVQFSVGGVSALLADVTSGSIGTSTGEVAVDLESAGVDTSSSGLSLRLNFWQGGASTLEIDEIRLE